jgi:hypothetical protein
MSGGSSTLTSRSLSKSLNLRALGESERIVNIDAQTSNGAFNLGVAQKNLNGAQVASPPVNDGRFGSAQRVGAIVLSEQSNPGHPLINKSCILPGADMTGVIDPARKDKVAECASMTLPFRNRLSLFSQNIIVQTCWSFNARLAPTIRPAFHGRRSLPPGSYTECPISLPSPPDFIGRVKKRISSA